MKISRHELLAGKLNHKFLRLEFISTEANLAADCGGITYQPGAGKFTLRRGKVPRNSTRNEMSWLSISKYEGTAHNML